jgi:membrane-bound lytic murein transglycosylase D
MKKVLLILSLVSIIANQTWAQIEDEMDFPEAMTFSIDSLMSQYMSKTYLTTDNDCQMKDENPTFEKEVYIDRLHRMPTIMEMPYNEEVRACIDRYSGRLRRSVSYMLGASNFYMPIFEEALDLYQLPLELKYLPIIESALSPTAVSRAGATGLWQFMLTTGKAYGLEVNSLVDERRDPVKSSYAAARYLRDLYTIFGDWNLVIAAYNCGPENINKAIRRSGGEKDYWKLFPYLPKETRGYVPAFIAANYVMNYYCDHDICPMNSQLPVKTDTIMVDRNVSFNQIASVCELDIQMLRALNPAYRRDIVPGATKPSPIRLPIADVSTFIDRQDSVFAFNDVNQKRLEVNIESNLPATKKNKSKNTSSKNAQYHKVRKNETLGAIARKNGTTVNKLKALNGLRSDRLKIGQSLRVR